MAKRTKKEQTIVVTTQFTYIDKGEKNFMDPEEFVDKVNAGFKKLAEAGTQPWDDIEVKAVKVFQRD